MPNASLEAEMIVPAYVTPEISARMQFIRELIGKPWEANAKGPDKFDCWHLAVHIQYQLFGRLAPEVAVPENPKWPWMIEQFTKHPELQNWVETLQPLNGLIKANDGAIVLMARHNQPAHCGVWLGPERGVIHCDERDGVLFQDVITLRATGWAKLRFFEPR